MFGRRGRWRLVVEVRRVLIVDVVDGGGGGGGDGRDWKGSGL